MYGVFQYGVSVYGAGKVVLGSPARPGSIGYAATPYAVGVYGAGQVVTHFLPVPPVVPPVCLPATPGGAWIAGVPFNPDPHARHRRKSWYKFVKRPKKRRITKKDLMDEEDEFLRMLRDLLETIS